MLQDNINKIKDYFVGMEMYNGLWVVRVKYRPKWGAYPPEDGTIDVVADENEADLWWYCAKNKEVEIDAIINLIEETIQTNLEAIKKVELFKLKANELKQIFSDESISLSKLQTLRFVFNSDQQAEKPTVKQEPKKKMASKKDFIEVVTDEIKEHNVFTKPSEETQLEEPKTNTNTRKSVKKKVEKLESTTTPADMTQEEINELRG